MDGLPEPPNPDRSPDQSRDEPPEGDVASAPGGGPPRFTRRRLLTMAGAGGLIGAGVVANWLIDDQSTATDPAASQRSSTTSTTAAPTTTTAEATSAPADPAIARWSDPATWGGAVPGEHDVAVVGQPVLLDVDADVAGVRVEPGGELTFDPAASRSITSTGNIVVAGVLRARPQRADITHVVTFLRIHEGRVVGDHTMEPLDTDIGLWVVGPGVLDLQGTPKRAWTRLATAATAGATTITVADADGWHVGDEVVVTPTEPPTVEGYAEHDDRRLVVAVDGATVTLDRALEHPHPSVTVGTGVTHQAEVLNLTRNVRVQGTPGGRAHVMLLGVSAPQKLGHVGLRHLGPHHPHPDGGSHGVVGRYALHFHMCGDAVRGSEVEGAVAYDCGNHAFVPHLSNGVTFRDCIAHRTADTPFWWDQPQKAEDFIPSHGVTFERCVASVSRVTTGSIYDVSGFVLGRGTGNVARGCVAVAGQGGDESTAGYKWVGDAFAASDPWAFEDCVSHNNDGASIYFWVNGAPVGSIDRFTAYHDRHGIRAGAYTNLMSYRDTTVHACREVGVSITAVPGNDTPGETVRYDNLVVDQAGLSDYAVMVTGHVVDALQHTLVTGGRFAGGRVAQVGFPEASEYRQLYEFVDCTFDGNAFWLADPLTEVVDIRVRDAVHGSLSLHPAGSGAGEVRPEWNAAVAAL